MYQLVVFLHVVAAAVWVGGMLFLAMVVVPATRGLGPEQRGELFTAVGRQFRRVGWSCVAILVVTGALNLWYRGVDPLSPALLESPFGQVLVAKLLAVAAMLGLTAYHDFVLGPASARSREDAVALRRRSQLAARVGTLLGLVVVGLAVILGRGVPGG